MINAASAEIFEQTGGKVQGFGIRWVQSPFKVCSGVLYPKLERALEMATSCGASMVTNVGLLPADTPGIPAPTIGDVTPTLAFIGDVAVDLSELE
jgi:hypothetical protein